METDNKFTPGPWRLYNKPKAKQNQWIESIGARDRGDIICVAPSVEHIDSLEMWEANAKLIAAAPDLLEACKAALNCLANNEISIWIQEILTDAIKAAQVNQK